VRSGSALIGIVVVLQLAANVGFWVAASNITSSDAVGDAGELVTSLQFVVYLTGMGLTVTNSRFGVGAAARADALLAWSVLITTATSTVGAILYLLGLNVLDGMGQVERPETLSLLTSSAGGMAALALLASGTAVALLVDVRLMAMRRYDVMIGRAVLIGGARIGLLWWDHDIDDALWLFAVNVAPTVAYAVAGLVWLRVRQGVRFGLGARPEPTRQIVRFAAVNYGAAAGLLLPAAIAQVALVEGSRVRAATDDRSRTAMAIALGIAVLGLLAAIVGNDLVTIVYGDDYDLAARHLPYFMASAVPWAIASVLLSDARVRRDHVTTVAITAALGVGSIVPALVLVPRLGASGAIWAWLGGTTLAAVAAVATSAARRDRFTEAAAPASH
jgi:hypothetical protein